MRCPMCGAIYAKCPECGKRFKHGKASHYNTLRCQEMNTPLDCIGCGRVVCNDLSGVLDFDMNFISYQTEF